MEVNELEKNTDFFEKISEEKVNKTLLTKNPTKIGGRCPIGNGYKAFFKYHVTR